MSRNDRLKGNMPQITLINVEVPEVKNDLICPSIPLGALYLASSLREKGISVEIKDYQLARVANHYDLQEFMDWLEFDSPYLGFSCNSAALPLVVSAISRIKKKTPRVRIVIGGTGPSLAAERLAEGFPQIDHIITGEGEITLYKLLTQDQPRIIHSPRIENLDEFPCPAYHLIDLSRYLHGMISSRGCPYNCSYCSIVALRERRWIKRDPRLIVDEMKHLREKYSVIYLNFYDDLMVVDRKWFTELLQRIISADLGFIWNCWGKVGYLDKGLLELMAAAGCASVGFGVESGSDRILERIGKDYSIKKAQEEIALAASYMKTKVTFMWGFPYESYQDFQDTFLAVMSEMKRKNSEASLFLLAPVSRTGLYEEYHDKIYFEKKVRPFFTERAYAGYARSDSEIIDLITACPEIFCSFYCYRTPEMEKKIRAVKMLFTPKRALSTA